MVNCAGPIENFAVWSACTSIGYTVWWALVILFGTWAMLDLINGRIENETD